MKIKLPNQPSILSMSSSGFVTSGFEAGGFYRLCDMEAERYLEARRKKVAVTNRGFAELLL